MIIDWILLNELRTTVLHVLGRTVHQHEVACSLCWCNPGLPSTLRGGGGTGYSLHHRSEGISLIQHSYTSVVFDQAIISYENIFLSRDHCRPICRNAAFSRHGVGGDGALVLWRGWARICAITDRRDSRDLSKCNSEQCTRYRFELNSTAWPNLLLTFSLIR
jgi:hypothetical protein